MKLFFKFVLGLCLAILLGCDDSQEKLIESTKVQSEIDSVNMVTAENANLRKQALAMEQDLASRHRFYQSVKGIYEGPFSTPMGEFRIRLILNPNISPIDFEPFRENRRLEEIVSDLNNLSFNIQVMQWNPKNPMTAVSCLVENIRPDLEVGEVVIASSDCPNLYAFRISDAVDAVDSDVAATVGSDTSRRLSQQIRDGEFDQNEFSINILTGTIRPSTYAASFFFKAERK
jgi:hypothetical protein